MAEYLYGGVSLWWSISVVELTAWSYRVLVCKRRVAVGIAMGGW